MKYKFEENAGPPSPRYFTARMDLAPRRIPSPAKSLSTFTVQFPRLEGSDAGSTLSAMRSGGTGDSSDSDPEFYANLPEGGLRGWLAVVGA